MNKKIFWLFIFAALIAISIYTKIVPWQTIIGALMLGIPPIYFSFSKQEDVSNDNGAESEENDSAPLDSVPKPLENKTI